MTAILSKEEFEKSIIVMCDCGCELFQMFKETPTMIKEPVFGFIYFNSFIGKLKHKRTYFEFLDIKEVEKLCDNLTNSNTEDNVCLLTDYYLMVVEHDVENKLVFLTVYEVNHKTYAISKKCEFGVVFSYNTAQKLASTLSGWIKNNI